MTAYFQYGRRRSSSTRRAGASSTIRRRSPRRMKRISKTGPRTARAAPQSRTRRRVPAATRSPARRTTGRGRGRY